MIILGRNKRRNYRKVVTLITEVAWNMETDFILMRVSGEDLHSFDPHFTDSSGTTWTLSLFKHVDVKRESYQYEVTKYGDGFVFTDSSGVHMGWFKSVADWQKIKIPRLFCEQISRIGISNLRVGDKKITDEASVSVIFNHLHKLCKSKQGYYSDEHLIKFDMNKICDVDGYVGYSNQQPSEFTDGRQFYRPLINLDVIMWVWEMLYLASYNPW